MKDMLKDRKILYFVFGIVLVFVFTLTIAYAALNTILKITGTAEVVSSSWDIRFENVKVKSGSVSGDMPTILNNTTANFSTILNKPGDFYEFTIDVVNNGTIDAMIDSIEKLPQLTGEQAKYINYIIEYENGESISSKQLVEKDSFVRLKVKVEYRKDVTSSDLPSNQTKLDLSFKLNYVQANESGTLVVPDNGVKIVKVISGDGTKISDEVCIGSECFYVISSDDNTVTMLAKMNITLNDVPVQSLSAGTIQFSNTNYWNETVSDYPAYVYDSNSSIYNYVESYKLYLGTIGVIPIEARLITMQELENLKCNSLIYSCSEAPNWVYSSPYWSGSANSSNEMWSVSGGSYFNLKDYTITDNRGVRPVITISKNLI